MSDERSPDLDLDAAHLRPGQRTETRPRAESQEEGVEPIPWEGVRLRGVAAAFVATLWRFAAAPAAAYTIVPVRGGWWRPWSFALLCGAVFGVISELIDSSTVALLRYGGADAELFQLDVAGRSFEWLPISVLSLAGCLLALVVGAPLYVLFYSLLVILWIAVLHLVLKISGGLASSEAGFEGTLRVVCYSQTAMAAAIIPWIGDPIAVFWSFALQVVGLTRMHGCTRARAAIAVGLPLAALLLALVLSLWLAEPESAVVLPTPS